ncbi:MAG: hypothetical protein PHV17_09840 [Candidatus Omnitrophica bacterium]|nr:hypothetical protein [Candidatus Omnitrophota bacterium]
MELLGKFKLSILDPEKTIFEGDVDTIFIAGDTGEFELMAYHFPVLSLLRQGDIIIDWKYVVAVTKGILRFFKNDCVILVEMDE